MPFVAYMTTFVQKRYLKAGLVLPASLLLLSLFTARQTTAGIREQISLNSAGHFMHSAVGAGNLIYNNRPKLTDRNDNVVADTRTTESVAPEIKEGVLKKGILPSVNDFISNPAKYHQRPDGNPGNRKLKAASAGLKTATVVIRSNKG